MRRTVLPIVLLVLLASGCSDDSTAPADNTPTTYEIEAATSWFVTSPDVDLSKFSSASVQVTFRSDVGDDMTFSSSPQFQLWSDPDAYDFVTTGDVTIHSEPSGVVSPGNSFAFDLTVDLSSVPANQRHIAIRPKENNLFGTLGPTRISVVSSEVTFTQ